MNAVPKTAMVLAAGLGTRLRPLTETTPKPLLTVAGRSLLDHCLDRLVDAGVQRAVVNIHWLGEQIRRHLQNRQDIDIVISDESDRLLETGGGIARALPLLCNGPPLCNGPLLCGEPFLSVNSDLIWRDARGNALRSLAARFDAASMDALLLLQPTTGATGYEGMGDFLMDQMGGLTRRDSRCTAPFVYTGVQIVSPRLFDGVPQGEKAEAFSLNRLYDRAIEQGRLFGLRHEGDWMDVGNHAGMAQAEVLLNGGRR
ncbi:nucleotidyltransferase family protein [Ferrovibrio sp.]|uniref:nucleotidyltransferase family protein n=1 Tax=Ferrovibrio sp. TaxID=1917215 RepID=UPI0035B3EFAB